ncbi:hypothetical protein ANCCEY_12244 [Ancylostoma ceylanicum]|uniref:B box-type domain-containing protein n=1 Tax=Ancylostoma ceylanicum TaxID=53326 RepID=A0A0D6L9N7_9BILA|nr:hypothetical protein ANCCEY_12244 [Ancylostoma ceylanicum]
MARPMHIFAERIKVKMGEYGCNVCNEEYSALEERRTPRVLTGDVRQLKKNFALLELIERIQQSRSGGETVDRYARDRLLGIDCDEDPCHTAVLFCTEETCSNRNGLMCTFCRDYGLHKGHAHVLIERETDELREKLQESISEVTKTLAKVETLKRRLQKAAAELSNRERGPFGDALTQVRSHFNRLRESLCRDEEAALDTLTSHVNGRVAALNSFVERMDAISNKLNSTTAELQRSLVLDRSKLVERKNDLLALAESASMEEVRPPEESLMSTLIPYSISRTNRLHLGQYEDARVVFLGLDGAGKTTLLRSLMRAPHVPDVSPTNG